MIKGQPGTCRTDELKGRAHIHFDHFHPSSMLFQVLADRLLPVWQNPAVLPFGRQR